MSSLRNGLTPRLKPLSARKSTLLSVLDVGTSKVVCLIAQLLPASDSDVLRRRTHQVRVLGIGHQRSLGLKGGIVVDLEAAEQAIRQAVDAAERMAKVEVQSVIVNLTGGRLAAQSFAANVATRGTVTSADVHRVLDAASAHSLKPGRVVLHALPTGYALDGQKGVLDPVGMIGENLGVDLSVVTSEASAARNLMLAVERCHLDVEAIVASPYAAGIATLVDDEAEMGGLVIDLGGGTTSFGAFFAGHLVHADAVAVGGHHVTMDVARGLSTHLAAAERLKTLYGGALPSASDEREIIAVPLVDESERDVPNHMPKSHLVRIIRPRVEEILELVRDRLKAAGFAPADGRRVILTGGASQLTGLPEVARRILAGPKGSAQVRIGRPLGIKGLPEAAKGPAFAAAVGLLVYPQVAHIEHFEPKAARTMLATGTDGYLSRMGRWFRESF
ncbi:MULTISPECIES: cell division protein FtsA [Chelatococcus]|uniref:Cell division protein FtsA n=1 Tax=Chelatococcus caeni TaxID=1348468 RepID=A0A840C2Q0_9HYPH|nr:MULTISPECIES: cell division protein FtsA [Chelatococcus]ALA16373.1 cell division protein FtsA [Chelatococcus sp. CO-6]MBB4017928.1 cell division protein FtsA [Chelatococcus caeni]